MRSEGVTDVLPARPERVKVRQRRLGAFILAVSTLLSCVSLWFSWRRYQGIAEAEAVMLAESLSAAMHFEHIASLTGGPDDLDKANYILLTGSLTQLVKTANPIYFAYILGLRGEEVIFLADSEPASSPDYSPPGQVYSEASRETYTSFDTGVTSLTKPYTDRWGTWVSVLVPFIAPGSTKVTAVLGLDYSASEWFARIRQRMVPDVFLAAGFLLLCFLLLVIWWKHSNLKALSARLAIDEALFHSVFTQAPIGIAIVSDMKFVPSRELGVMSLNPMFKKILGRDADELTQVEWPDITYPADLQQDLELFSQFRGGEIEGYSLEKRFVLPDGSPVWTNMHISRLTSEPGLGKAHLCLLEDISSRRIVEEALREAERSKSVLLAHLPGMAYRCRDDGDWTMAFASEGCLNLTGYTPQSMTDNRDISYNDIISPEYRQIVREGWKRALDLRSNFSGEYEILTKSGERKWVLELGQGIYAETGSVQALEGIIIDITEQKKREAQIVYMNNHDLLTGLLNRGAFDKRREQLDRPEYYPLSVIICDIDGLRLINDAFGYEQGDQLLCAIAGILRGCCGKADEAGRTGGDEFTILMPNTGSEAARAFQERLERMVSSFNRNAEHSLFEVSLSVSYATKESGDQAIDEVFKNAGDYLIHRKLLNRNSSHNAILSSIMAALYARSQETEEHGERMTRITKIIGEKLGLKQDRLDDLELLSILHDIGKIAIDDRILNKPGKLTADEWELMKKHTEIGYRIAKSSPEFEHIAVFILHHHERWDGTGYPKALKGDDIPLESRILAVADAYDAMTHDSVYRRAKALQEAAEEIRRCAGTQFDPDIALLFVELMQSMESGEQQLI